MRSLALLKKLYRKVTAYFKAENNFMENPSHDTWCAKVDCDRRLCGVMTEIGYYLKSIEKD